MMNAILLTKGTWGDIVPFLAVGRALKQRGHTVTLVTHASYEPTARRSGLEFAAIDTQDEFTAFIADGHLLNHPGGIVAFFRKHYLGRVEREYRLLLSLADRPQSVLISRHMAGLADLLTHERTGVPIIKFYLNVAHLRARFLVTKLCQTVLRSDLEQARTQLGFAPFPEDPEWPCGAAAHIAAWPQWFFEKSRQWPANSFAAGFLMDDEAEGGPLDSRAAALLESSQRAILVTGGTGLFLADRFYHSILSGCASLPYHLIVTSRRRDDLPDDLPANAHWFPFLPFAKVIPRVAAVIHHAGTGTLARALLAGVPQLLLPFGGDRPDTAARVQALGVGRLLLPPQWHPDAITDALNELLASSQVRTRCSAFSHIVQRDNSAKTTVEIVERTLAACDAGCVTARP